MKIIERIVNVETNEVEEIERDATPAELQEIEIAKEKAAKQQLELLSIEKDLKAKEAARQAVLDKLGLTPDEVAALLA